jgi:hypothetical protein
MASQTRSAGGGGINSSVGNVDWFDPNFITVSDGNDAVVEFDPTHQFSRYLISNAHGFTIPEGAVITGILVEIQKFQDIGGGDDYCADSIIRLIQNDVVQGNADRASAAHYPDVPTYVSHGGVSDLWGNTWTPEIINGDGFGVAIQARGVQVTSTLDAIAHIDHVRITVYYTPPYSYGMKISKPGFSVLTAAAKNLIFSSALPIFKTKVKGSTNLTISGGTGSVTITHSLGYKPAVLLYYYDGTRYLIDCPAAFSSNSSRKSSSVVIGGKVNTTQLNIKGRGTNGTYPVYYELFFEGN